MLLLLPVMVVPLVEVSLASLSILLEYLGLHELVLPLLLFFRLVVLQLELEIPL